MIYNSIEEELWKIFTFYALHSDPTQPELLRPANFIRFSKDCQIVSKKLTSTAVELEMAKLFRSKGDGTDYTTSITIKFDDFMELLDTLSSKVYPRDPPEIAAKRLLLENILLLANRRIPIIHQYDINNTEAIKVVSETFGKSLNLIFKYYLDMADSRRNHAITSEKVKFKQLKVRKNNLGTGFLSGSPIGLSTTSAADTVVFSPDQQQKIWTLKDQAKRQKDLISYKEFLQFCQDFSLKSTSLLTAIQVGDVYLSLVELPKNPSYDAETEAKQEEGSAEGSPVVKSRNQDSNTRNGMNFDLFLKAIIYMSQIAFRDCHPSVSYANKVKALLLYMWKGINASEKTTRLVSNNRSNSLSSIAGSLNVYGSGHFSDFFMVHWQKEGYPDYSTPPPAEEISGAVMIRKVTGEEKTKKKKRSESQDLEETPSETEDPTDDGKSVTTSETSKRNAGKLGVTIPGMPVAMRRQSMGLNYHEYSSQSVSAFNGDHLLPEAEPFKPRGGFHGTPPVSLDGTALTLLLHRRPELAEFLSLEIQNMKLQVEKIVSVSK